MRSHTIVTVVALAVTALPGIAAHEVPPEGCRETGTHADGDPARFVCEEADYFHCHGDTKVANVEYARNATLPSWDTTPPAASVQAGAGCGWADNSAFRSTQAGNSVHDGAWKGTFTGNLSTLTVRAHAISGGPGRLGDPQTFRATLFVNGVSMFGVAADGRANRADVTVTPVVSSSQLSALYEFSITGLPFVTEPGEGTTEREIILNLAANTEPMMAWVYDTTEVDSGITFNPEALADVRVVATP